MRKLDKCSSTTVLCTRYLLTNEFASIAEQSSCHRKVQPSTVQNAVPTLQEKHEIESIFSNSNRDRSLKPEDKN